MSGYRIATHTVAAKQLESIYRSDRKLAAQFDKCIQGLVNVPYPQDVAILQHTEEYDLCRTKVGRSWRLLYAVMGGRAVLLVLEAISRESAYKGKELETLRSRIRVFLDLLSK